MTKILVFGTGSLGTVYTWVFSNAIPESDITAICRSNYDAASKDGFTINSTIWGKGLRVRPRVVRSVDEVAEDGMLFDYVVVTAKALPATPSVAELIKPVVTKGRTSVVLVQNGIGIEEEYVKVLGDDVSIISTVVYLPATQTSPAVVEHDEIEHLHVGTYPSDAPETHKASAKSFVELLHTGGASATLKDDIQAERWKKLVVNASWNPICALTRLRDVQFVESGSEEKENKDRETTKFIRDVMMEVASIAQACGYNNIGGGFVDFQLNRALKRSSPGVQPSMLADAFDSRTLEVDAIVGNAVKIAKEKGVDVPLLRTIFFLAQGLSASFSQKRA
ncbi:2-dehydropantoate 2-reductase [Xylariaceae sp. FL1019]|nr:2-dehydropantoate 2-reductase [Xylariaceae sp. FL1019]